jgi:hypothetical protein
MNPTTIPKLTGSMNVATTCLFGDLTRLDKDRDFEHGTITYVCALLKDQKKVIHQEIQENHEFIDFFDRVHLNMGQGRRRRTSAGSVASSVPASVSLSTTRPRGNGHRG